MNKLIKYSLALALTIVLFSGVVSAATILFPYQGGTGKGSWTLYAIPYLSGTATFGEIAIGGANEVLSVNATADGYDWVAAGAGDVSGIGDCASGACLDGTADGGTYIRIYDGDSNYAELNLANVAADYIVYLPTTTGTLIHTELDPTVDTAAEILAIIDNTALDFGTGVLTATGFSGPLTGNASTATALAGDPADCSANQFANAINASGT